MSTAHLDLLIGPLHYRLESGDAWGKAHLQAMACHLRGTVAQNTPDRVVRLARETPPGRSEERQRHSGPLGTLTEGRCSTRVIWSETASSELPAFRYHLPWALMLTDIAKLGGTAIHAGFAARDGRGLLFLAPPSGGKSTTLAAAPDNWEVLSDDAALVWPAQGGWVASPLPSWTMLTLPDAPTVVPGLLDLGVVRKVCGLVVIAKEQTVTLERLPPIAMVPHLYRALNEYHATVLTKLIDKELFFTNACDMARTLPCWRFGLPLGVDIRPQLDALYEQLK